MTEKRLRPRLKVYMPIQVIGRSSDGEKFREICQTQDASAFGLCFTMQSTVERGTILYLSMRMPRRLRLYDLAQDLYQIYAQVQHIKPLSEGVLEVGVCFLGKNPPPGYENYKTAEFTSTALKQTTASSTPGRRTDPTPEQPVKAKRAAVEPDTEVTKKITPESVARVAPTSSAVSSSSTHSSTHSSAQPAKEKGRTGELKGSPREKRRDSRFQIPIDVRIEFLDSDGNTPDQEPGLVLDISKHGARVMSTREARVGSRIKITMMHEDFSTQASVKAVTTGQGGIWNLHVEFLDKRWMGGAL